MKFYLLISFCFGLLACESKKKSNPELAVSTKEDSRKKIPRPAPASGDIETLAKQLGQELITLDEDHTLLREFLEKDEDLTLSALGQLKSELNYELIGDLLLAYFENRDPEEALAAFRFLNHNASLATPLLAPFLERYAETQPQKALAWLAEHDHYGGAEHAAARLGTVIANQGNEKATFETALNMTTKDSVKENLILGVTAAWLKEDFNGAFEHLSHQSPDPIIDRTFYHLVNQGSRIDAANTMPWTNSITNEGLRRSAILETAIEWQATNPETYQNWKRDVKLPEPLYQELP